MRRALTVMTALIAFALPATAWAADPGDVADAVADRGYYVESGVSVDTGDVSAAVARAGNAGFRLMVVLLDGDPSGGAPTFAGAVLDRVGSGTVLVLSANQEGADTTEVSQAALAAALDAGFAAGGGDEGYVDGFVSSLIDANVPVTTTADATSTDSGGMGGVVFLIVIVGGLVLLVVWAVRRQSKQAKTSTANRVTEARAEIQSQLDVMANTILEITDRVSLSESREDNTYLEAASATYTTAMESFEAAGDLASLEALSDQLDEARWQLDAAEAIADGRPAPEKPAPKERHACFFDPTHSGPLEQATIHTGAGDKLVMVCRPDAEKLRRGQAPDTRMIEVGGRRVPAASAPRSYGGGGLDWLDVFSVVVGGMGSGRSYDWGGSRSRTVFGGSRSASSSSSSRSLGRAVGRTRTRSSGGGTRSRAGRTRGRRR